MTNLLDKLNYKGQKRISVINAEETFILSILSNLEDVLIDQKIDPRYPYDFIIIFVKSVSEVEMLAPMTLHNLKADGVLWVCYPKKTSKKYSSDLDRDHGWKVLNDSGLFGIRLVAIDQDWSALRFRNIKFIKSTSGRFIK
jgi:hypothetical protein